MVAALLSRFGSRRNWGFAASGRLRRLAPARFESAAKARRPIVSITAGSGSQKDGDGIGICDAGFLHEKRSLPVTPYLIDLERGTNSGFPVS